MNGITDLNEISEALGLAWTVYEQGWPQDQSPNPQLSRFGEEIRQLAVGLGNLIRVIENARICYQQHAIRSPTYRGNSVQRAWNLVSLHEICGMFKATISECERILVQNWDCFRGDTSAYSEEWIMVMKPKVEELCQRLRIHNVKLSMVLKPLETKLLAEVQQEFAIATQYTRPMSGWFTTFQLQGLVVLNLQKSLQEYREQQTICFEISKELESQLRIALEQSKPELKNPATLRICSAVDLIIEYFDQSTRGFTPGNFVNERKPSPRQYINLLNSLLIFQLIQQSHELRLPMKDSIWPFFVAELGMTLRLECQRFSSQSPDRLLTPDLLSVQRELNGPREAKLSKEDVSKLMSPHFKTFSHPVLTVALPSTRDGVVRQLSVSRVDMTKLHLVESVHEDRNPHAPLGEIVMDIDLASIQLTPIYATPSSRPRPLEVLLHTATGQLNPSFNEVKHIYRLQHLLTGYKVYDRYDQAMVKVSFFISGQSSPLEEHGRIQLWLPQPYNEGDKSKDAPNGDIQSQSLGSTVPNASAPFSQQNPDSKFKRSGSLRKWIPGLRKASSGPECSGRTDIPVSKDSSDENKSATISYTRAASTCLRAVQPCPNSSDPHELPSETSELYPSRSSHELKNNSMYSRDLMNVSPAIQSSWHSYDHHISSHLPYTVDDLPEIAEAPFQQSQVVGQSPSPDGGLQRDLEQPAESPWPYSPDSLPSPSP
ncbi:uncharacterized protein PV09_00084 [Verruconis gallopava]|uniref:Uncharacterized protein n=1 Tax=Verruconis gallopava TaxID=253628 RepID=A0A0D2AR18_9PEZI|nr:uncharacterized protein PV09_00084 [Verruconis gallopava]KIW09148.1 hypothetical protein PV09_00084 [Verruconis gallopava]